MLREQENIKISKFLSLVLRHRPQHIGVELDTEGWTDVNTLINKAQKKGVKLNLGILKYVVDTNVKKRFSFNTDYSKIRASQGHSVEVNLNYKPQTPPAILYHGTGLQSIETILINGLSKMRRHHVHLSTHADTAIQVGQRHGEPTLLKIAALEMANDGYSFFLSDNDVWLTEHVPAKYITVENSKDI